MTIKSIDRAVIILDCFKENTKLNITQIASMTGLSKSSAHDTVSTLVAHHFLEQNPHTKDYELGSKLFELGALYNMRNPLAKRASPYCEALSNKYRATVHLTTFEGPDVIYIGKFENPSVIVSASYIGKRLPMVNTGVGKAILSQVTPEYLEEYVMNRPIPRPTPKSHKDYKSLLEDLIKTKERGYALDNEEVSLGLKCVAAPIFDNSTVIGAISVSYLAPQYTEEDIPMIAQDVMEAARNISLK